MGSSSPAGCGGITGIVAAFLAVSVLITLVTDTYGHWPPVLLGLVVSIMIAARLNR